MDFNIDSLTARELLWDTAGVWLAGFVVLGVLMEAIDDFDKLAEWTRLTSLEGSRYRKKIAHAGLLILIVALACEVVAAIESHAISEQIITGLNSEVTETQQREQDLIKLTNGLKQQLIDQGTTLDSLGKRSTAFEDAASAQKDRDDRTLALLKRDETNLEKAHQDLNESAGKVARAADIANKAATEMTTTLDAEKVMRQQMQEKLTPRQIDDAHFAALVTALKSFVTTPIEVGLTREDDAPDLMTRITDALVGGQWEIKPWSGGGIGLKSSARPNLPAIGDVTAHGIQIVILESDREKLSAAALALANGLANSGLRGVQASTAPEKLVDAKPDPLGVKPGIIRLIVGSK